MRCRVISIIVVGAIGLPVSIASFQTVSTDPDITFISFTWSISEVVERLFGNLSYAVITVFWILIGAAIGATTAYFVKPRHSQLHHSLRGWKMFGVAVACTVAAPIGLFLFDTFYTPISHPDPIGLFIVIPLVLLTVLLHGGALVLGGISLLCSLISRWSGPSAILLTISAVAVLVNVLCLYGWITMLTRF